MASALPTPVTGIVDAGGRLTAADADLLRLQEEAGSRLGKALAVPQLAAIARLARKLGVPVSRPAVVGTSNDDIDLWVRAEPAGEAVRLVIDSWVTRPAHGPRWWGRGDAAGEAQEAGTAANRFVTDPELRITELSAALAQRLAVEERPKLALTRLFRLEADDEGEMPLLAAVAMRGAFSGQLARARDGADEALLLLSGEPIIGADGQFAGFDGRATFAVPAGVVSDTGSAGMNELLRQPLDLIIQEAQAITARAEGPLRSDYAAYASDIATAGRHLLEVLRAIGEESLPMQNRIDLRQLAGEAAGLVQPQARTRAVSIVTEGNSELWAHGQARAVTQILVNLIGNAARHSLPGGTVRVLLGAGQGATATVIDDGPGVPLADQQRIFERFEQAEPRGEGAGLGLAISRRLAQSMGGDIGLNSIPGQGARFTLTLPLA